MPESGPNPFRGYPELTDDDAYHHLRARLIIYFRIRGFRDTEPLADEVFARVLQKLNEGTPLIASIERYCYVVAHFVSLEERRKRRRRKEEPLTEALEEDLADRRSYGAVESDAYKQQRLLEQALQSLPPERADLVVRYFAQDRRELARTLELSSAALAARAHRIIRALQDFVAQRSSAEDFAPESASSSSRPPSPPADLGFEAPPDGVDDEVNFTLYHPVRLVQDQWYSLLLYAHRISQQGSVRQDAMKHFGEFGTVVREAHAAHSVGVPRGTVLRFVPEASGLEFNPPYVEMRWSEDIVRASFRCRVLAPDMSEPIAGRVSICIGVLEIASIAFAAFNADPLISTSPSPDVIGERSTAMYANVFPSYSRKDAAIVRACKRALEAIGCTVLMDVEALRSGEAWSEAILRLIDRADIFQLFWSSNSAVSEAVTAEWQYALDQCRTRSGRRANGEGFIRPVYWKEPPPLIPALLNHLHFRYVADLDSSGPTGG